MEGEGVAAEKCQNKVVAANSRAEEEILLMLLATDCCFSTAKEFAVVFLDQCLLAVRCFPSWDAFVTMKMKMRMLHCYHHRQDEDGEPRKDLILPLDEFEWKINNVPEREKFQSKFETDEEENDVKNLVLFRMSVRIIFPIDKQTDRDKQERHDWRSFSQSNP